MTCFCGCDECEPPTLRAWIAYRWGRVRALFRRVPRSAAPTRPAVNVDAMNQMLRDVYGHADTLEFIDRPLPMFANLTKAKKP